MVVEMSRPYKLLVVDDEDDVAPMFRQSMRQDVRQGRYQLLFAGTGVEALECLEREPDIDLVITDINMPDMDGLTLLQELSLRGCDLRSVVLSAYGDMKNIRVAMGLGAVDFVPKPVDFEDMRNTIERTLRSLMQWREAVSERDQLLSLRQELDLAGRIQQSMLPPDFPSTGGYEVDATVEPAREVAGDFYDIMRLDGGRVGLVVADVADKGVPAALMMMAHRTLIRGAAIGLGDPARVLAEVNSVICENNPQTMFVTVFFCILDPSDGTVSFANAGHPSPLLLRADGVPVPLPSVGDIVLGLLPGADYELFTLRLEPGDVLFMYTDGVTEAMNAAGEEFGEERLVGALSGAVGLSAVDCTARVVGAVREFSDGRPPSDDVTCVTLRREF